jgi:hypothetical protein
MDLLMKCPSCDSDGINDDGLFCGHCHGKVNLLYKWDKDELEELLRCACVGDFDGVDLIIEGKYEGRDF